MQMERARVKEAISCQSCEEASPAGARTGVASAAGPVIVSVCCFQKPVVVVSNLRKEYQGRREGFSLKRSSNVAANNVSFCVRKGSCCFTNKVLMTLLE